MREELLEEVLIQHCFDFKAASREFIKTVNKDEPVNFFKLDIKTLQLRWTDIEIRKYRLNDTGAYKSDEENASDDGADLPPLEKGRTDDNSPMEDLKTHFDGLRR